MLHLHRHRARHAARKPAPAREPPPPPPERFAPLRAWLDAKARGEWTDPRHEDMYRALLREWQQWEREQRGE